ncbi:hypothetical protein [Catenuloplanes japonicus]|uniref:hypothetical protein n=1 Tax=Catenuloplanes japonicus TaxID=33876 RepID=UPI000A75C90A|nr:hypothetical protein [Catenuloplanes japonicus]
MVQALRAALPARPEARRVLIGVFVSALGPVTAGPLIGAGGGTLRVGLTVTGCLVASVIALSLHGLLTPAQDGRAAEPATSTA